MNGEFPGSAPAEDFTKMPIEDRLASKAWKARVSAYEELVKSFARTSSDGDPIFRTYARNPELVRAMVVDSNAVAQEKGVDAARAFVEFGGNAAGRTREAVMPSVVEKCLGSARAGTKKTALELILLYAENEDVMGCEGLTNDILAGLKAKQPKVVAGCVTALRDLTREFGHKQVKPNQILKKLPDIFGHSDKTVRAEGALLAQELYRCIGAAIEPTISALKEIQAKELRQQFEAIDAAGGGKPTPTRYLLSQKAVVEAAPAEAGGGGGAADEADGADAGDGGDDEDEIDPYDLADPVDVFGSRDYPGNFDEMLASKKWQERKEVLDTVLKILTSSLKVKPDPRFDSLTENLALKIAKDANINVVMVACQCLEAMAKGLREGFARYKERAVPPIIEKFKEKKATTVEVLAKTLDAIFQTVSFSDILEHILTGLKHKNPAVKTESIRFLVRCLRTTRTPPAKGDIKPIGDALVAAMGDGSPDVRDAGAAGLGTLMKLIGERPMNVFLEPLDDIKKGKVQEEYKQAEVKVKMTAGAPAKKAAPAAAARKPPAPAVAKPKPAPAAAPRVVAAAVPPSSLGKESARPPPRTGPPARLTARKPAAAPAPAAAAAKKAAAAGGGARGGKAGAASATEPVKYRFSSEDAEARAAELIPENIAAQLASGVWKERLTGMTEFNTWLDREVDEVESEIIVRALGKKPGWKESNFQVLAEVYKVLRKLAESSPTFGRPSVALSVQPLCDKLGDIKLKGPAAETLGVYAEKTSYGFLLNQALGPLAGLKAPKAIADSILWVDQSLLEFGTSGVDVRGVIDFLVNCLKSANAAVRTNATKAIGTLARFLGTALNTFLSDINPQLRTTIEGEIEKAASNPPPAPTRFSDENRAPAATSGGEASGCGVGGAAGGAAAVDEDLLDQLVPRVDLDKLVSSATIARMSDANWKERKEALEEVQSIVTANTRLKGNMTELAAALKLRYTDSNIMCKTIALDVVSKIAGGMNKNFEPHARILVGPITQVLSDAKAPVRASAAAALTAIVEQIGIAPMVPGFCSVLDSKSANPMLRQDLFAWLGSWFENHMPEKGLDLTGLALPAVQSLDDKLAAVRKAAQSALPYIILRAGYKFVLEQANQLKAASRNTVVPLIDAAKAQAAALQPAAAPRAAPAAAPAPTPSARTGLARPGAAAARPAAAVVAPSSTASSSARSSPVSNVRTSSVLSAARAASPSPASPRASAISRPAGLRAPSAVGRSLKAPSSSLLARQTRIPSEDSDSGPARSRLGLAKKAPAAAQPSSSSSSSMPSSSSAADHVPPLLSSDLKPKVLREKREGRGQNWIGPEGVPRPELVDVLRSQCEGNCSRGLVDSLFSKANSAEKDYMSALTLISDFVSSPSFAEEEYGLSPEDTAGRIVANSDLVFKYIALRLTDNNTTLSMKCLEILEHLVELLSGQHFHMSDYEANSLLPCLIAKFGDPKVTFRDRIREIFRKLTFIFPPSKLFTHYMDNGLPSKNAKVRAECLGELGHLISKNGLQVCSPSKALPVIAKQISDRDANVRTAALLALGEAYKLVGDDVRKMIGPLPGKEMSLLEERLKRTSAPAAKPSGLARGPVGSKISPASQMGDAGPSTSSPARAASIRAGSVTGIARPGSTIYSSLPAPSAVARSRLPAPGRRESAIGIPRTARSSVGANSDYPTSPPSSPSVPTQDFGSPRSSVQGFSNRQARSSSRLANSMTGTELGYEDEGNVGEEEPEEMEEDAQPEVAGSLRVEQTINEILSSDAERSVAALKDVHQYLEEGEPAMVVHADRLGTVLAKQAHRAFSSTSADPSNERLIKHLLFDLLSMFDKELVWEEGRPLGSYLSKATLVPLLTELLQQLIEESAKPPGDERAQTLAKYLNSVVLKCFSACDLNALYGACLSMLTEATEDMRELSGGVLETRVKFAELTMKCLWKIAKRLPACLADQQIDPSQLIADIEEFMKVITPTEWKRRAADGVPMGDMPLKTMKVILTHITTTYGEESLSMLELLENPESSHVYSYLMRLLNQNAPAAERGPSQDSPTMDEAASAPAEPDRPVERSATLNNHHGHHQNTSRASVDSSNGGITSPRSSSQPAGVAAAAGSRVVSDVEDPATVELRAIFERISHKEQSRIAIRQLYEFQKKYPHKEASIQRALQNTGPIFQRYVKRALANHAADDLEANSAAAPSPQLGDDERRDSGTFSNSTRTSLRSSLNLADQPTTTTASSSPTSTATTAAAAVPRSAAGTLHSPSSSVDTTSPKSSTHLRSSTTDERLAELRAKFAKNTQAATTTE
ncbi:hypothetical protein ACQY0O_002099 [Thecaphora frezii]